MFHLISRLSYLIKSYIIFSCNESQLYQVKKFKKLEDKLKFPKVDPKSRTLKHSIVRLQAHEFQKEFSIIQSIWKSGSEMLSLCSER